MHNGPSPTSPPDNHAIPGVLIVDDRPANRRVIARALQTLDVVVLEAGSGPEALELAAGERPLCVAILDVRMPGMDGYTVAEQLRREPRTSTLPLIFVSAIETDAYHHHRAYETGAVDFLSKPVSPRILLSKVKVFLDLYRQRSELEAVVRRLDATNAELSRQTVRLETSAQVSHQIASILDVDDLLVRILSLIRQRFGFYFAGIWLLREPHGGAGPAPRIELRAGQYGIEVPVREPYWELALDQPRSIIAHVCRTGEPYLTGYADEDPLFLRVAGLSTIQSELALPLRFGNNLIGALDIQDESRDAFSPGDVVALRTLADQIAVAIRNARLYAETRHLNEDLEAKVQARTAELETAYRQLELLDRSKTDFLTVVSHELRTPLTLINGFSQMLLFDPAITRDSSLYKGVQGIVTGAERMRTIVNSMLDIVRIDSRTLRLEISRVQLANIVARVHTEFREAIDARALVLTIDGLDALPEIEGDSEALSKAIGELLSNAVKYTPDGGRIGISGRVLTWNGAKHQPFVEIVVSDTGIGISPEVHELIFDKFYRTGEVTLHSSGRTKYKGGGPGLGLTVARGIVEAHGGHIWAESPGYDEQSLPGSSFHIVLPVSQPADRAPAPPQP